MRKWLALFAMALTIGCGAEQSAIGANDGEPSDPGRPVNSISLPIVAGTELAKVVVRRGDVITVTVSDPDSDDEWTEERFVELFRYVTNLDPSSTSTINIPYGDNYTVEVIAGGLESGGVRPILAYYKSDYFDVPGTLTPAIPEQTMPALSFPDIYAGLGAPYDEFTVAVNDLAYPFAPGNSSWSLTCDGANPVSRAGATATFAAPDAAGSLAFVGKFHLDPSLLIDDEAPGSWELTVNQSADPQPFESVNVIP